jgi:hypothetical protein
VDVKLAQLVQFLMLIDQSVKDALTIPTLLQLDNVHDVKIIQKKHRVLTDFHVLKKHVEIGKS